MISVVYWVSQAHELGLSLILNPDRQAVAALVKDLTLHADQTRLDQLMSNLVDYVIGAAPRGSEVYVGVSLITRSLSGTMKSLNTTLQNQLVQLLIRFVGDGISQVSLLAFVSISMFGLMLLT